MTDAKMALLELVEQEADTDLVREILAFAAERMMDMEIEAKTGAAAGCRSADRLNHRNGYRDRNWDTRAGRIDGRPTSLSDRLTRPHRGRVLRCTGKTLRDRQPCQGALPTRNEARIRRHPALRHDRREIERRPFEKPGVVARPFPGLALRSGGGRAGSTAHPVRDCETPSRTSARRVHRCCEYALRRSGEA